MADDPQIPDGDGLPGDDAESYDGGDLSDRSSVPGLGCGTCGYAGGDCMSPGSHCPIYKRMFTVKPTPVQAAVATPIVDFAAPQQDQGGVWVTYFSPESEDYVNSVSVHPDELSALRVAVQFGHDATFLTYGDVLP